MVTRVFPFYKRAHSQTRVFGLELSMNSCGFTKSEYKTNTFQIHLEYMPHTIQIYRQIHLEYIENDSALIILKALKSMQCKV
jgi:hypothetical protein